MECIMSITTIAMSHREEPRDRRLENDSCPGVSIMRKPGIWTTMLRIFLSNLEVSSFSFSDGKNDAPIYCVIPPSSESCTLVFLMWSSIFVFPVSTCPNMQITGLRKGLLLMNMLSFALSSILAWKVSWVFSYLEIAFGCLYYTYSSSCSSSSMFFSISCSQSSTSAMLISLIFAVACVGIVFSVDFSIS